MPSRTFDADVIYSSSGTVLDKGGSALQVDTTGATTMGMAAYGVSLITATSSEIYTLNPPKPGLRKMIVCTSSSSAAQPVIRGSTAQTVTFDKVGNTMFKIKPAASTHNTIVTLVGLSSVQWAFQSIFPTLTTGVNNGVITLSTV